MHVVCPFDGVDLRYILKLCFNKIPLHNFPWKTIALDKCSNTCLYCATQQIIASDSSENKLLHYLKDKPLQTWCWHSDGVIVEIWEHIEFADCWALEQVIYVQTESTQATGYFSHLDRKLCWTLNLIALENP